MASHQTSEEAEGQDCCSQGAAAHGRRPAWSLWWPRHFASSKRQWCLQQQGVATEEAQGQNCQALGQLHFMVWSKFEGTYWFIHLFFTGMPFYLIESGLWTWYDVYPGHGPIV